MKTAVRSLGGFRPMKAQQDNTRKDFVFTFAGGLMKTATVAFCMCMRYDLPATKYIHT